VLQYRRHSCQIIDRRPDNLTIDFALRTLGTERDKLVIELVNPICITLRVLMDCFIADSVNLDGPSKLLQLLINVFFGFA